MDDQTLAVLKDAFSAGGWLAALPVLLPMLVNAYKHGFIQKFIPDNYKWDNLGTPTQLVLSFLITALPVFAVKIASAGALSSATLSTAIGAASVAAYATVLKPVANSETMTKILAGTPEALTRAASIVIRPDMDAIAKVREDNKKV